MRQLLGVAELLASGELAEAARQVRPGHGSKLVRPESSLPELRSRLFACALVDLVEGGWTLRVEERSIFVAAPVWLTWGGGGSQAEVQQEKALIRESLQLRVEERLSAPATRRFVATCEFAGVLDLVTRGARLVRDLDVRGVAAVQPFLVPARPSDGLDKSTGLRLQDIFRYFRMTWSFPLERTPGRTLPFLIRDGGQPGAPICGLLSLASPIPRLSARDVSFGWSGRLVLGLHQASVALVGSVFEDGHAVEVQVASCLDEALGDEAFGAIRHCRGRAVATLARLLELPASRSLTEVVRSALRLPVEELRSRDHRLRRHLVKGLIDELDGAIASISLLGLPMSSADLDAADYSALEAPLEEAAQAAHEEWVEERRGSVGRSGVTSLKGSTSSPLFTKKRARRLSSLLRARAALRPLVEALLSGVATELRAAMDATRTKAGLRALEVAAGCKRSRLLAAQVADVSVCGAVPPYGELLGGKLAGLLALSADVSQTYYDAYDGRAGEIQATLAGRPMARSGDLLGLSTTSFFPVVSAQYNRLRLPEELGGTGWSRAGVSRGVGSLHFSAATSALAQELILATTGARFAGGFDEGPSERLRKVQSGLSLLGLPLESLLRHGMRRPVYTAALQEGLQLGEVGSSCPYRLSGPSASSVASYWRRRWLSGRLQSSRVRERLMQATPEDLRISGRLGDDSPGNLAS